MNKENRFKKLKKELINYQNWVDENPDYLGKSNEDRIDFYIKLIKYS